MLSSRWRCSKRGLEDARESGEPTPAAMALATVSAKGEPIESLEPLRGELDELERRYRDAPPPCPDWFGAVRVVPSVLEFWEERPDRLHERVEYRRGDGGWTSRRLAP